MKTQETLIVDNPFGGKKRPFGISGILRLKDAEASVEAVIDAFMPHLDEIVAVYADCDDATPEILERLKLRYPDKLRVFHYPSPVAHILSRAHHTVGRLSPESIANYYNWAFEKASYSVVTKIDHDHLPVEPAFASAVAMIRREKPQHFLYTYSGLNLAKTQDGEFGVPSNAVFAGLGDHWFFDLAEDTYFEHLPEYESLVYDEKRRKKHLGLLYWHIKRLLPEYPAQLRMKASKEMPVEPEPVIEWDAFKRKANREFSFWGNRVRRSFRRAFEGRAHWLVSILSALPNLNKLRGRMIYKNVCQLRQLDELPEIIQSGKLANLAKSGGDGETESSPGL